MVYIKYLIKWYKDIYEKYKKNASSITRIFILLHIFIISNILHKCIRKDIITPAVTI